jgi:glycosyltransferase involved in cell wall biosynthesis
LLIFGGLGSGRQDIAGVEAFRAGVVDEIHPAIAGVDLLLHLATSDTLGTAVIDAMALGVPPIAFGVSGLPELIDDRLTGMIVPPGDIDAFADTLTHMILTDARRRDFASRGPARSAQFSVERMVERVLDVYRRVLPESV